MHIAKKSGVERKEELETLLGANLTHDDATRGASAGCVITPRVWLVSRAG